MVNAERLLDDLKKLRKKLEIDLRRHHASSAGRAAVEAEWQEARDTKRTADTFETFFGAAVDQAAVHWILALVFVRFLEANSLLDRPLISGAGEQLELAQMRQREHFRAHREDSDAEYLLAMFGEVARLPGLGGLYDPAHNPLFRLPVSGDGAKEMFDFFRQRGAETGAPLHDFTDPDWDTRFLGDLYQDLSEEAQKRFALLQTPEFVEAWILSRTLDPAIREFGIEQVRMIDPTCGSGHFLLGGFIRLLEEWRRHAPEMPPAAQAQKALDAVAGVDLNPFAVEIARFRLLVAALKAAGEARLAAAPDFHFQLAIGDSLLHGRHFSRLELGGTEEGFRRVLRHHYAAEDMAAVEAILGCQYHAVVGNPPYISPKDAATREAYRELYVSCHGKYGLGAPFTERFLDLAVEGTERQMAGFVGLIVANSFMKREFGKKLISEVLPKFDLTHIVDTSSAYIPGHTTPTVILFGRARSPFLSSIRTVRVVSGAPEVPENPAEGVVWQELITHADSEAFTGAFMSSEDTPRTNLAVHPWNMGGGGASDLQAVIEEDRPTLASMAASIGVMAMTGEDDVFRRRREADFHRSGASIVPVRRLIEGGDVREWILGGHPIILFPYSDDYRPLSSPEINRLLWPHRSTLDAYICFGRTKSERGMLTSEYGILVKKNSDDRPCLVFGEIATHNHFVFDRGGKVCDRTAPVIKLAFGACESEFLSLLGLLNSSSACFWMKQVMANKGGGGIGGGLKSEYWDRGFVFNSTKIERFPLPSERPFDLARALDAEAQRLTASLPIALCATATPTRASLDAARAKAEITRARMIALQEELDWRCYRLYGLYETSAEHLDPPPLQLGERAFEIVMARRMVAGELETAWFARHRSTCIIDLPVTWPEDYRAVIERRIALIEADPNIGLIERPEYKRRWQSESWEKMEQEALRAWLLDRLEDPRFWDAADPCIVTTRSLADATRADAEFQAVAELYVGRAGFDVDALLAELVTVESVPFLAAFRYSETGLRKRADWEATWEKQRAEDAVDAELAARRDDFHRAAWSRQNARDEGEAAETYTARMAAGLSAETVQKAADAAIAAEAKRRKAEKVGDIPVPPKYKTPDFQSAVFWRLRGALDVPKERFVCFPHCARDSDSSLPILWAGHNHLARARALASLYVERRDTDGWASARLLPMLAGLLELVPWLRQWHNDIDAETGLRMGDYFASFIEEEARERGLTINDLRNWTPPARRTRARRAAA